jgi:uncharacterized protein (TIGR00251 family)
LIDGELALVSDADGVGFHIHVTPRARTCSVGPLHGDALRVAVTAPPVSGRANKACVEALAKALGVSKSSVEIDPATKKRRKRVRVRGDSERLAERLHVLASHPGLG